MEGLVGIELPKAPEDEGEKPPVEEVLRRAEKYARVADLNREANMQSIERVLDTHAVFEILSTSPGDRIPKGTLVEATGQIAALRISPADPANATAWPDDEPRIVVHVPRRFRASDEREYVAIPAGELRPWTDLAIAIMRVAGRARRAT